MAWTQIICEGQPGCPGKVIVVLHGDSTDLIVEEREDSHLRFPCSIPGLLGVHRGTRTHLASEFGECVLSKEADGVWIRVQPANSSSLEFFVPSDEYLLALTKLVEAKAVQRRVMLK